MTAMILKIVTDLRADPRPKAAADFVIGHLQKAAAETMIAMNFSFAALPMTKTSLNFVANQMAKRSQSIVSLAKVSFLRIAIVPMTTDYHYFVIN